MTGADRLSGLLVNTIYKDYLGYVWLGTDNGLDRFDGMRICNYAFEGLGQTMKKRVNCVVVTPSRQLFVGNGLGLWCAERRVGVLTRYMSDKINTSVNALYADGETLYAGTDDGLYIIDGEKLSVKRMNNILWSAANKITDIECDKAKHHLWMTTQDGLVNYDMKTGRMRIFRKEKGEGDNYFRCLTLLKGSVYVGTMSQGLLVFDTRSYRFVSGPSVGANVISDLSNDGHDKVFVATDGNGVHYVSHRQNCVVKSLLHDPGDNTTLSSNSVYSLLVDRQGLLWVGTYRTGLDYTLFHRDLFGVYQFPPVFTSANQTVNCMVMENGERYIGTRDGLFYINERTRAVRHFKMPQLTSNIILSLRRYGGQLYVGTYGGGLMVLDPANTRLQSFGGNLSKGHVFCLSPDRRGCLWIGSSDGVYRFDGRTKSIKLFDNSNSQLPAGNVYAITFDSSGKGWICTETGLCIFDPQTGSIRADVFPDGFVNRDKIRYVYEDSRHQLYFVREKGDLFTSNLSMDHFGDIKLPFLRPDMDNSILSVVEDRRHNLWIACSDGLYRMKNVNGQTYDYYTSNDGLPDQTFTNSSSLIDERGKLWFGNTKGLVFVDPDLAASSKYRELHPVRVTGILVNGEERAELTSLTFDEDNLTFFFSDMSFGAPGSAVYEYRLEGVDNDWRLAVATGQASYYNLSAGTYKFHVRTPGNPRTEATLTFSIPPFIPWWTWLFVVAAAIVSITLVLRHHPEPVKTIPPVVQDPVIEEQGNEQPEFEMVQNDVEKEKISKELLTEKECVKVKHRIVACMEKKQPYLNKNLKSADIAEMIGIQPNLLSYVLNQYMKMSFADFVNDYRIREFKRRMTEGGGSQLTLTALAEECGFGSNASFFRAFKKTHGITPKEYLHNLRSERK